MGPYPIMVDSSYYITRLKRGVDVMRELAYAAASRDLVTCGVVRCEVARGIGVPKVLQRLRDFWDQMIYVPTDNRLWFEIETLAWEVTRQGNNMPLQDVIIACCAKRAGAVVLTFDKHFSSIPGLRVAESVQDL